MGETIDDCFSLSDWQGIRLLQWSMIGKGKGKDWLQDSS